jgi:hypothetical protein
MASEDCPQAMNLSSAESAVMASSGSWVLEIRMRSAESLAGAQIFVKDRGRQHQVEPAPAHASGTLPGMPPKKIPKITTLVSRTALTHVFALHEWPARHQQG